MFFVFTGNGGKKDEAKARKRFLIAAEHGYVDAQFNLGMMYLLGLGGTRNTAKVNYWLKQAALQGDGQAFSEVMKFQENDNCESPHENDQISLPVQQSAQEKPNVADIV